MKTIFASVVAVSSLGATVVSADQPTTDSSVRHTFLIQGLHCPPCVRTVETSLGKTKGVHEIKVDWSSKNAKITFDERLISAQQVAQAIAHTPHMMGRNMRYEASLALKVSGLKEDQAEQVKTVLGRVPGVVASYVYLQQQAVGVRFQNAGKLTSTELITALNTAGFTATPY